MLSKDKDTELFFKIDPATREWKVLSSAATSSSSGKPGKKPPSPEPGKTGATATSPATPVSAQTAGVQAPNASDANRGVNAGFYGQVPPAPPFNSADYAAYFPYAQYYPQYYSQYNNNPAYSGSRPPFGSARPLGATGSSVSPQGKSGEKGSKQYDDKKGHHSRSSYKFDDASNKADGEQGLPKEKDLEETFFFFYKKLLPKFQEKFPALNLAEIFRLIFLRWQTLPMSEKMVYFQAMVAQRQGKTTTSQQQTGKSKLEGLEAKTVIEVESEDSKAMQVDPKEVAPEKKTKVDSMEVDSKSNDKELLKQKDKAIEEYKTENEKLKKDIESFNQRILDQEEKIAKFQQLAEVIQKLKEEGEEATQQLIQRLRPQLELLLPDKKKETQS